MIILFKKDIKDIAEWKGDKPFELKQIYINEKYKKHFGSLVIHEITEFYILSFFSVLKKKNYIQKYEEYLKNKEKFLEKEKKEILKYRNIAHFVAIILEYPFYFLEKFKTRFDKFF